jgi:15-cis-phytoene desaturase
MARVAVLGGGIGGLTAAHELIERGFEVDLYEASDDVGGKARSQDLPGTAAGGRLPLPGEHGFRFYPAFYRHVTDTMGRTPTPGGGTVLDRLIPSDEAGIAADDDRPIHVFSRRPMTSPGQLVATLEEAFGTVEAEEEDLARFSWKVLLYLTSCRDRRDEQYANLSWWDFLEADEFSADFQGYVRAIPRTMVAMDPERGAAKTIGDISMQLLLDFGDRAHNNDRTMDGPTSERWIAPWRAHLESLGVRIHTGARVDALEVGGRRITTAVLGDGRRVEADWFVGAVPVEVMQGLVTDALAALDDDLHRLRMADAGWLTSWMVGAQYFLRQDAPIVRGHIFFPDSPWALTAISQAQFWNEAGPAYADRYGDGQVHGVLSVDISDWFMRSPETGLAASQMTDRDAVLDEIWRQVKQGLNATGRTLLRDEDVLARHLDTGIRFPGEGAPARNDTPLLVHPPGSAAVRPPAATSVENLVLAADYVATKTDLASMEGASEAGRRAVNALLDRAGSRAPRCQTWALEEPPIFDAAKRVDEELFERGLPHLMDAVEDLGDVGLGLPRAIARRLRPSRGLGFVRAMEARLKALAD